MKPALTLLIIAALISAIPTERHTPSTQPAAFESAARPVAEAAEREVEHGDKVEIVVEAEGEVKLTNRPWVSAAAAKASPKPDLYLITNTKTCMPCRQLDVQLSFLPTKAALTAYDCVKIDLSRLPADQRPTFNKWAAYYKVSITPTILILNPDDPRYHYKNVGAFENDVECLHFFNAAEHWLKGQRVPAFKGNVDTRRLAQSAPDLAVSPPPIAKRAVAAPVRSVLRSPGIIGRSTFRPQRLLP